VDVRAAQIGVVIRAIAGAGKRDSRAREGKAHAPHLDVTTQER